MWDAIDLREIRTFLLLSQELHFGRTADHLGVSQSRVSQLIRTMETKLGGKLVDRTSRRVVLTPLGEKLLSDLRGPAEALGQALAKAEERSDTIVGDLRISLLTPLARGPHFPAITGQFRLRYPECTITVVDHINPMAVETVQNGKADLLVSWLPVRAADMTCGPILAQEPRVLAVARDHPLAGRDCVTLEDVADYAVADMDWVFPPEIGDTFVPRYAPNGRPIRRISLDLGISGLPTLIARGEIVHPTVACYAMHFGDPNIVSIPVQGLPPICSALLWRSSATDSRIAAFVRLANEVLLEADADEHDVPNKR